jgi:hypothetical protein
MIYNYKVDNNGYPIEKCLSKYSPEDGVMIGSFLCRFDCIKQGKGKSIGFQIDCLDIYNASLSENRKSKLKNIFKGMFK